MKNPDSPPKAPLRVIDALDHPHGGRILRVQRVGEPAPTLRALRGAELRAYSPEGIERSIRVLGFPLMGGKASEARYRETGRLDLIVREEGEGPSVAMAWELHPTEG